MTANQLDDDRSDIEDEDDKDEPVTPEKKPNGRANGHSGLTNGFANGYTNGKIIEGEKS